MKTKLLITLGLFMLTAQATAQVPFVLEWSADNVRPGMSCYVSNFNPGLKDKVFDLNNDGTRDPGFFRKGANRGLIVINGVKSSSRKVFSLADSQFDGMKFKLIGYFFVAAAKGRAPIVLGRRDTDIFVIVFDDAGNVVKVFEGYELLAVYDFDKDNQVEMLLNDPINLRMEQWGRGN